MKEFEAQLKANGLENEVKVIQTGCFGLCELGPIVVVYPEGTFYSRMTVGDVKEIVEEHILKGRLVPPCSTRSRARRLPYIPSTKPSFTKNSTA
jgi:(2Fe-2S) ferredoxin